MSFNYSRFYDNMAQDGGVILLDNEGYALIQNCEFDSNLAINQGGVVDVVTKSYFTA